MPTAKDGYFVADGARVPSVTTVISKFKDAGGLIHWAWKLGKEGKDYREERDKAADAGTLAHAMVDAFIHGRPCRIEGAEAVIAKAKISYGAFLEWADQTRLVVTHTELPLISELHRFGGTFDAATVRAKRSMTDWKTSNNCYPEYLIQVAAYGRLWDENFPYDPITGGYHLLRFDKEFGDFHAHWWSELDAAWEAFLLLRRLYDLEKELRKRVS